MNINNESKVHSGLKNQLKKIMIKCGFKVDREVHLNLTGQKDKNGNYEDDLSVDVIANFSYKGKNCMMFFECKDVKEIKSIKSKLSAWENNIKKIQNNTVKVIKSSDNIIKTEDFKQIDNIKLCFVMSGKVEQDKFKNYLNIIKPYSFTIWDSRALKYYDKLSSILGEWVKYEIFKEFNFYFEVSNIHRERAVEIKQPGYPEMYMLGIHPGLLLKIVYVCRRVSNKPEAYQRILSKDRIRKISEFLSSNNILLPNAIVVAFDEEKQIQKEIVYDHEEGYLQFPIAYCSAWIIDGQHRVFGFLNTKYKEWDEELNEDFKLPVIIFKKLDPKIQSQTFVNINYYQKKIDPTLLCDLTTAIKDLKNELTWPSLLVSELNRVPPLKNCIKISEFDVGKPITLSSFARYGLLESLLGFNKIKAKYNGPLYKYAPFNITLEFDNEKNQKSFKKQLDLLKRFFKAVKDNTSDKNKNNDPWTNFDNYSLLKTSGINALLLVLSRIMEKYPEVNLDLSNFLKPLKNISFEREKVASYGGGWKGFRNLANEILRTLNNENGDTLRLFGEKEKI